MYKQFIRIIVQKVRSNDFRSFCICKDSHYAEWELRGFGTTPMEATQDVYEQFLEDEKKWTGTTWPYDGD
jgi:hypothetical protein